MGDTMKGLLVFNEKAGGADAELLPRLRAWLGEEVILARMEEFASPDEVPLRARALGCDWVAAAGGDGTIEWVATALMGSEFPLGVIPVGTFNNFARSLSLPLESEAACAVVRRQQVRAVDVAFANGRPFFECLGAGLDASLFPLGEEIKAGRLGRWFQFLRRAASYQRPRFVIEFDRPASEALSHNTTNESRRLVKKFSHDLHHRIEICALMVTVSNGPYFGMNFAVAPEERMDDGLLTVSVFHRYSKVQLFWRFASIARGRRGYCPKSVAFRVARLRLSAEAPVAVHLDGTPQDLWPLEIECRQGVLKVFG